MSNYYINNGELYHYGVVGMKWGIRKARKQGVDYAYKSMGQKRQEKKLQRQTQNKASAKDIAKTTQKLETIKARDKRREAYARQTDLGKTAVKSILMGPLGSGNYNRMKAAGANPVVSAVVSNWVASTAGYPISYLVTRHVENKAAKKDVNR